LTAFLILLGVAVLDYVLGLGSALVYPDLRLMVVWGMVMVGLLTILLHVPMKLRRLDSSISSVSRDSKTATLWAKRLGITFELPSENAMRRNVNMMFQVLLSVFLLCLLAQQVLEFFVPFDLNFLLVEVVVFGVFSVVFKEEGPSVEERSAIGKSGRLFTVRLPFHAVEMSFSDLANYVFLVVAGIAGAGIVFFKTQAMGWISYVVSVISGVLIVLLSVLVLEEED